MPIRFYKVTNTKLPIEYEHERHPIVIVHSYRSKVEKGYIKAYVRNIKLKMIKHLYDLEALYWIYLNDKKSDIIGFEIDSLYLSEDMHMGGDYTIIGKKRIIPLLDRYPVVIASKTRYREITNFEELTMKYNVDDILTVRNIIAERFSKYLDSFDNVMIKNSKYENFSFIARYRVFMRYCDLLFSIYEDLAEKVDLNKREEHQKYFFVDMAKIILYAFLIYWEMPIKEAKLLSDPKECRTFDIREYLRNVGR